MIPVFCKCQRVSRPVFCKCQQGSELRLVFCKCQQAQGCNGVWEKSRFHGEKRGNHCHRFSVNVTAKCICGLTILWKRIGKWLWRSHSHGERWGNCYHRFNVNITAKHICGPTILWVRIGRWLWRENQMGTGPVGFLANPQLSTGLICLYQLPFELG